jgi:hypothetical protein
MKGLGFSNAAAADKGGVYALTAWTKGELYHELLPFSVRDIA